MKHIDDYHNAKDNQIIAIILNNWLTDERTHSTVNITANAGARAIRQMLTSKQANKTAISIVLENFESIDERIRKEAELVVNAMSSEKILLAQTKQLASSPYTEFQNKPNNSLAISTNGEPDISRNYIKECNDMAIDALKLAAETFKTIGNEEAYELLYSTHIICLLDSKRVIQKCADSLINIASENIPEPDSMPVGFFLDD